jgi:hypothetical protein
LLYRNVSSREDKYKEACFKVEISRRNPTNLISTNNGNVISGSTVPSGLEICRAARFEIAIEAKPS